jgi:hypothetical protein
MPGTGLFEWFMPKPKLKKTGLKIVQIPIRNVDKKSTKIELLPVKILFRDLS